MKGFTPFLSNSDSKASVYNEGDDPRVGKIPWRRKWQPTPILLPGKSHGWRSLIDYSPCGRKESDKTEQLHFLFHPNLMLALSQVFPPHLCAFQGVWSSASDLTPLRLVCKVGWEQSSLTNVCEVCNVAVEREHQAWLLASTKLLPPAVIVAASGCEWQHALDHCFFPTAIL